MEMGIINLEQVLHMVGEAGETSYAANSRNQEKAILGTKPILESAIEEMYRTLLPARMVAVDLGCASGPNTLLVVSQVLDIVGDLRRRLEQKPPEIHFFLNDLPGNDFNSVFRSLEKYKKKNEEEKGDLLVPYYIAGVAGSFYGRLFPSQTVHFFHSSYSLMWLSQVPEGLQDDEGVPLNKGNIYIAETSPPEVVQAYQEQHRKDLSTFLKSRHAELSVGGGMVLTFLGRKKEHPANDRTSYYWGQLAEALNSMVSDGIITQDKVDSFNLPFYGPTLQEAQSVIDDDCEGFYDVEQAQIFEEESNDDDDDDDDVVIGKDVANITRAVSQPLIAHHFGDAILDGLFSRLAHIISGDLQKRRTTTRVLSTFALKRRA